MRVARRVTASMGTVKRKVRGGPVHRCRTVLTGRTGGGKSGLHKGMAPGNARAASPAGDADRKCHRKHTAGGVRLRREPAGEGEKVG